MERYSDEWTPEQLEWLQERAKLLPDPGYSYGVLTQEFNDRFRIGRTRNSILGKVQRMGWAPGRKALRPYKQATTRAGRVEQAARNRAAKAAGLPRPQPTSSADAPDLAPALPNYRYQPKVGAWGNHHRTLTPEALAERMAPKPVADISEEPTSCAKPLIETASDECRWPIGDGMACGRKIARRSYCAMHCQLAYVEPYQRRRSIA